MLDHEGTTLVMDAPAAREAHAHDHALTAQHRERAAFDAFDPFDLSFDPARGSLRSGASEFGTP